MLKIYFSRFWHIKPISHAIFKLTLYTKSGINLILGFNHDFLWLKFASLPKTYNFNNLIAKIY